MYVACNVCNIFSIDQWDFKWENYKKCIADINVTFTQRFHLFKKSIKMHDNLQKIKSTLVIYIRIKYIELNVYLHSRNVLNMNSFQCNCEWSYQIIKHILMHCLNWMHLRLNMLQNVNFMNYQIIIAITKNLKTTVRMMMKMKLLKQFRVTRALIL